MFAKRMTAIWAPLLAAAAALAAPEAADPLRKPKAAFEAQKWKEAETGLIRFLRQSPRSASADEAAVLLIDVYLRQDKDEAAAGALQRFRRQFATSPHAPRVQYYQGLIALRKGAYPDAARAFAAAAQQAGVEGVHASAVQGLRHLVDGRALKPEEVETVWQSLARDPSLGPWLLERIGDARQEAGRHQAAEASFSEYLERYPGAEGAKRVRDKLERARSAPREGPAVLLMAPFSGEFAEVGRSLREGVSLAFEEASRGGAQLPAIKLLDDQGNLIHGLLQFRKTLREERVDAVLGPVMSDVAAGVALDLTARKSSVPMVSPTATTHGIASLGEGVFQLNVTTHTLGRRIAEYACDCLGLKDFAIVAPRSEYGFQLADVFAKTVLRKGGTVAAVAYVDPEATDLSGPLQELRQKLAKQLFEQMKWEGKPLPEAREMRSWMSDSAFPVDGIFIPAANGEEANKLASQTVFNKIRGQMLGSSGWHDKALLHKSSAAAQGAYFSVDFQDQPKTEGYAAFSKAYQARWQRAPDRVSALSYDAARFLLQGLSGARSPEALVPALRGVRTFPGVLGDIVFGEEEGVNQNTALFRLEKRAFKEVPDCADAKGRGGAPKR